MYNKWKKEVELTSYFCDVYIFSLQKLRHKLSRVVFKKQIMG